MALNEPYPVYGLLRQHPEARRKARRFRRHFWFFVTEAFRNFDNLEGYRQSSFHLALTARGTDVWDT